MEITQEQKRKIFEELLIYEELRDGLLDSFNKQYCGSMSYGM